MQEITQGEDLLLNHTFPRLYRSSNLQSKVSEKMQPADLLLLKFPVQTHHNH